MDLRDYEKAWQAYLASLFTHDQDLMRDTFDGLEVAAEAAGVEVCSNCAGPAVDPVTFPGCACRVCEDCECPEHDDICPDLFRLRSMPSSVSI